MRKLIVKLNFIISLFFLLGGCSFSQEKRFYQKISKLNHKEYPSFKNISFENYTLQQGDNFADIAKKKNIRIDTLISANSHIKKHHNITANTVIQIPNIDGLFHKTDSKQIGKKEKEKEPLTKKKFSELSKKYNVCQNQIGFYNLSNQSNFFIPHAFFSLENRNDLLGYLFLSPLKYFSISSHFGFRIHPIKKTRRKHKGIDLAAPGGTMIYASKGGTIQAATYSPSYGNLIIIKHSKGYTSYYAHLKSILVRQNQKVYTGQPIGRVGNTGVSTGYHLHFEIRLNGKAIDPRNLADLRKKRKRI